jgi:hypothetical protein
MVGTFLPWMGAQVLASQANKSGRASVPAGLVMALAASLVCWVLGVLLHIPGAGWNLGSFGIAWLPGVMVAAILGALRARRA